MSIIASFSMFFLSFVPLWISVVFIDIKSIFLDDSPHIKTEILSILCIVILSVISLGVLRSITNPKNRSGAQTYRIISAKEEKTITSEFLLSYILPLFAFDFTIWDEVVLFLIFFLVFMFLCIRHNHFSANIMLELMNYRFYSCELENDDEVTIEKIVVCKRVLTVNINDKICIRPLNNEYSVECNM